MSVMMEPCRSGELLSLCDGSLSECLMVWIDGVLDPTLWTL